MVILDEARLYGRILQAQIEPCMSELSKLEMWEMSEEEEAAAKAKLYARTEEARLLERLYLWS